MRGVTGVVCAVIVLFAGLCAAAADTRRAYTIATVAWAGWSPLHVAQEKGFWSEQQISVEVLNYDDPIIILEAIKAGRIDFAMDMAGSLVGIYMDGTPVVALAETDWSHGGDKIIVKKGHTLSEYKGSPLGVFLNLPSCLYFLGLYLKTQQLSLSDFRIVELHPDDMAAQFIAGRLPVIVNYDPWALQALRRGNGCALATSADFEGCIPECLWGYRDRVEKIPPEDIVKILSGWIKAARWVHRPENWQEFCRILNSRTFSGHEPYPSETLKGMVNAVKIHSPEQLYMRNKKGGGFCGYLADVRTFLKKNGMLKKDFAASDLFENRYIMRALRDIPPGRD